MGLDLLHTIENERPAGPVFDHLSDFENNPLWQKGMVAARFTSDPPTAVGRTYVQEARFMGRQIDTHFRVSAYEPGASICQPMSIRLLVSKL